MARFSPIMREVQAFAERGGPVLGICNGFQILLEAGLLPGAMLRNRGAEVPLRARPRARRADRHAVHVAAPRRPGAADSDRRTAKATTSRRRRCSQRLEANRQVVLRYTDADGELDDDGEPERIGCNAIAGLCNEARNVVGMMPHPERACEPVLGGADGLVILAVALSKAFERRA